MRDIFQRATLNSSDKAIIIALALIVIVLVLVIMYKIDNIPENFTKRKKSKNRAEMYEDFEDEIEDEITAEEKMEELFNSKEENNYTKDDINQSLLYDFNELNNMTSEREEINITYMDEVPDSIDEVKEVDVDDLLSKTINEEKDMVEEKKATKKSKQKETEKKSKITSDKQEKNKNKNTKKKNEKTEDKKTKDEQNN